MQEVRPLVFAVCALAFSAGTAQTFSQTFTNTDTAAGQSVTYARDVLPILVGKCYSCHNDQTKFLPNWSDYKTAFDYRVEIKRRVWDSWRGSYYEESMPAGNSPQCLAMKEHDREVIKKWVDEGAVYGVPPAEADATSKAGQIELGRRLFAVTCVPCHQANGQGIPGRFPPLAASNFLNGDKIRAIQTLIKGREGEIVVNGNTYDNQMPRFPLTDGQIANVLTYVYNSFGNSGKQVTLDEVKTVRAEKVETSIVRARPAAGKSSPFE